MHVRVLNKLEVCCRQDKEAHNGVKEALHLWSVTLQVLVPASILRISSSSSSIFFFLLQLWSSTPPKPLSK